MNSDLTASKPLDLKSWSSWSLRWLPRYLSFVMGAVGDWGSEQEMSPKCDESVNLITGVTEYSETSEMIRSNALTNLTAFLTHSNYADGGAGMAKIVVQSTRCHEYAKGKFNGGSVIKIKNHSLSHTQGVTPSERWV